MLRNPVILQVSDLHFGKSVKPFSFWKSSVSTEAQGALLKAVVRLKPLPDFIVATGDLANRGKPTEFAEARRFLDSLLDALWAEGHAARCIVIPGNHDVWRTTYACPRGYTLRSNRLIDFDAAFGSWSFVCAKVPKAKLQHLMPTSLEAYYLKKGSGGDDEAFRKQAADAAGRAQRVCEHFPDFRVAFLKLDSNVRSSRLPGHIARGRVGHAQRQEVDRVLADYVGATESAAVRFSDARLITLVHHHVTRLPNVKLENWMLLHDAGEVAQWLARLGVRFILHGHYHQADLLGLTYWSTSQNRKNETIVVSAGAATATDLGDGHNSCHYVHLGDFRTRVYRPLLDNGEPQNLQDALRFEFVHRPELVLENIDVPYLSALEDSLACAELYTDHEHSYLSIESVGYIDNERSYWGTVTLKGTNVTTYDTHCLPYVLAAVGAQQFGECNFRARNLLADEELPSPELLRERPMNLFPCRVLFAEPLKPGQEFAIQLTFVLKGVMLDERDYDMLNLVRFPKGVNRMSIGLVADRRLIGVSLYELRGRRLIRSGLEVRQLVLSPPSGERARFGYQATGESPLALCYMLFYERLFETDDA